jgi:hypothetical protein
MSFSEAVRRRAATFRGDAGEDMNKLIAAIEALPDTSNVEAYPANYDSDEVLASFKGKDLKALVAQLKWTPVSDPPKKDGYYNARLRIFNRDGDQLNEYTRTLLYTRYGWHDNFGTQLPDHREVIAYMPIPPYTAERGEE